MVQIAVNSITEVPDAARRSSSRDLDAIVQVASNLTTSSFASLSRAADSARIPLFGGLSGDLDNGAAVVIARDYHDAGMRAAALAMRIMNGESPAGIPFQPLDTAQSPGQPRRGASAGRAGSRRRWSREPQRVIGKR